MKEIKAIAVQEKIISLSSKKEIEELYELISNDENFILSWEQKKHKFSELVIATNISAKVKNGEINIISTEEKTK